MNGYGVKVIVFDVFGTLVDWRGSLIRDLGDWGAKNGIKVDWAKLADCWRGEYQPELDRVRRGEIPWTNLDALHAHALDILLARVGIGSLTEEQRRHMIRVWHRLDAWPDSVSGLTRLKQRYVIGALSNGNVALLVNMAKHAKLPWDNVFSCELFRHYKPHPDTYLGVVRLMDVAPSEVMMCAAHNDDLVASRALGLRTAFIPRPTEHGPGQTTDLRPSEDWDVVASSVEDMASKMEC